MRYSLKNFFKNWGNKIAPMIPEFQNDLSKLDVIDRYHQGTYVPEHALEEYGFAKYPVDVLERCYGL